MTFLYNIVLTNNIAVSKTSLLNTRCKICAVTLYVEASYRKIRELRCTKLRTSVVLHATVRLSFTTSLTISWSLDDDDAVTIQSYTISYSNTNTDCFTDSNNITGTADGETTYTLTDLEEGTEYSITVTVLLSDGRIVENNLTATTMAAG